MKKTEPTVTRHIDTFNKTGFRKAYVLLEEQGINANLLSKLYQTHFGLEKEKRTVEALNTLLKEKTGFDNPEMSSDSIGKKKEYLLIVEMAKNTDLNNYEDDGAIKTEVFYALQDSFTKYYTTDQYEYYQKVLLAVECLNAINKHDAQAIQYNTLNNEFQYRKELARSHKQFAKLK
jgi:hypothetical protein